MTKKKTSRIQKHPKKEPSIDNVFTYDKENSNLT